MDAHAARARRLLAALEEKGASLRLTRAGNLVVRGASRLPAGIRLEIGRQRKALVDELIARERWARRVTDRERR